jgi:hypothetical protein
MYSKFLTLRLPRSFVLSVGCFCLLMLSNPVSQAMDRWSWLKPLKSESGNFCQDELQDLLRKHFGNHVRIYQSRNFISQQHTNSNLWARTNLCKGWIVANFMNESWECKRPHYFSRPHTLVNAYGFDGECRILIPTDLRW